MMKRIIAIIAASISCMIMLAQDLQFNQCADARTLRNESLPRWDKMLDDMFAEMKAKGIKRLIVDAHIPHSLLPTMAKCCRTVCQTLV